MTRRLLSEIRVAFAGITPILMLTLAASGCDGLHALSLSGIVVDERWRNGLDGDPVSFLGLTGWSGPAACFPIKGALVTINLTTFDTPEIFTTQTNDGGFYQFRYEAFGGYRNPFKSLSIQVDALGYESLQHVLDVEMFYTSGPTSAAKEVLVPLHQAELRRSEPIELFSPIPLAECEALTEQQRMRLRSNESRVRERQLSIPTRAGHTDSRTPDR